jgi:hypothetical protein
VIQGIYECLLSIWCVGNFVDGNVAKEGDVPEYLKLIRV